MEELQKETKEASKVEKSSGVKSKTPKKTAETTQKAAPKKATSTATAKKSTTTSKKATPKKATAATKKVASKKATSTAAAKKSTTASKKVPPKKAPVDDIQAAIKAVTSQTKGAVIKPSGPIISSSSKQTPITPTKPAKKTPKAASKKEADKQIVDTKKNEKRLKAFTKDEKVLYKKLHESFDYVANLTWVIEEKMMDPKVIPDLTLGELHVLEMVDNNNNQPMTKIANLLKVTVGSLTIGVNRLVQKEYLLRTRDEVDHRVIKLSVTPKAKKVLKVHDKFHEDIILSVLDGVTIRDATKVMSQFMRVLENYINPKEKAYVGKAIPKQPKENI